MKAIGLQKQETVGVIPESVWFARQQLRAQHGGPGMQPPPQQGIFPQQQGGPTMYTGMQQGMRHHIFYLKCNILENHSAV
jgi:hypothetical protein